MSLSKSAATYEGAFLAGPIRWRATCRPSHTTPGDGLSLAKTTRTILSGVCAPACWYHALATNPCRDVRISTIQRRPTALTADELRGLHQWLSSDEQSLERDLPDLVLFLATTGLRIGEALAVRWADVGLDEGTDVGLDEGTVEVRGTVLRLRDSALVIKPSPKSAAGTAHPRVAVLGGDHAAAASGRGRKRG